MDKRRHRRLSTRIDVFYSIAQTGIHPGVLLDYGKGGAFVSFKNTGKNTPAIDLRSKLGHSLQIHFTLEDKDHSLNGIIAHVGDSGMGIRFSELDPVAFAALTDAARRAALKGVNETLAAAPKKSLDAKQIGQRCIPLVMDFFKGAIPDFLDAFCESLQVLIEQRDARVEQQEAMDAVVALRGNRETLIVGVIEAYRHGISLQFFGQDNSVSNLSDTEHAGDSRSLSLVEKDEFEDWLQLKVATSRVELALREALTELEFRIEAGSVRPMVDNRNVFGPNDFLKAIDAFIKENRLGARIAKLMFRSVAEFSIEHLPQLYTRLNTEFVHCGVLPDLSIGRQFLQKQTQRSAAEYSNAQSREISAKPTLRSSSPRTERNDFHTARAENENSSSSASESLRDAMVTANRLLHAQRTFHNQLRVNSSGENVSPSDGAAGDGNFDTAFEANNTFLLRGLNRICNELSQAEPAVEADASKPIASQVLERLSALNINFGDDMRDALSMMDSLVANIADEQKMTGSLRDEFCKLQVPLAALQISDPEIFQSDDHPVRELLNYLALLTEPTSANFKLNTEVVKNAIQQLMSADPLNERAVNQLLSDLKKQIEREKSVIERNVHRIVELCEGRQRIAQVNEFLAAELDRVLGGKQVPQVLLTLLNVGWKELMRLSLLRDGPDSRAWKTALEAVDDLQHLLTTRPMPDKGSYFTFDALCRIVESGLPKVAAPGTDISAVIKSIRAAAISPSMENVAAPTFGAKVRRKDLQSLFSPRVYKKLQRIKIGQWLEFGVRSESKKLAKVAWVSPARDKFALVNQQGMRVAELSDEQLLEKLAQGDIVLLGDSRGGAVEKGLDALIQKIYERLSFDASHDQLTGVLSRKEFEKTLAQSVARAKRKNNRYALVYLDLLQFKLVNNLFGYEAGDQLLQQIAQRLMQLNLQGQVTGRIGGNEFALIFPVATDTDAFRQACQVKTAIENEKFNWGKQSHVLLTAVSVCTFDHTSDHVLELLRTVESSTQIAKSRGLKEVQMVKPGDLRFHERDNMMSWVSRINQAMENGQLRLRCQKIAPAAELHPSWLPHYEVLLTVVDDTGQHNPPAEFIKAAEEYGRMAEVDRWVITHVLEWMRDNRDQLKKFGGFSINLSGHTMNDDSFLDFIFEQLVRYGVPRDKVIFEITETTAVANLDEAADFITEMKEIGCRFSLDDFGAGQSSYAYLKKLPVDFIKIDGAFIRKIDTDKVDFALVKSITEMGHFLDKHIVAEFVSDQAKYETVVGLGVDYIQGWHVGKPVMLDALLDSKSGQIH